MIPVGVPAKVVRSSCWKFQFAYFEDNLFILYRTLRDVALHLCYLRSMDSLNRLKTYFTTPMAQQSMFIFRTYGEQTYF